MGWGFGGDGRIRTDEKGFCSCPTAVAVSHSVSRSVVYSGTSWVRKLHQVSACHTPSQVVSGQIVDKRLTRAMSRKTVIKRFSSGLLHALHNVTVDVHCHADVSVT